MEQAEIKIVVADHQALLRYGLRRLLDDQPGLTVVAEAASGEEAVACARELMPDVVLMDPDLSGIGGLEATRRIACNDAATAVVVIMRHVDDPVRTQFMDADASGYLTKYCSIAEITDAMRVVGRGERYISADIARQMALSMLPGNGQSLFDGLTQREVQVMMMVAQGRNVHAISERLCLSSKTVSTYRYRLFDKLGVANDVELTRLAIRHGIVGTGVES
jgi:two-component system invasion response regulator UvrY